MVYLVEEKERGGGAGGGTGGDAPGGQESARPTAGGGADDDWLEARLLESPVRGVVRNVTGMTHMTPTVYRAEDLKTSDVAELEREVDEANRKSLVYAGTDWRAARYQACSCANEGGRGGEVQRPDPRDNCDPVGSGACHG
jgi:hypothetical protein